jgi:hypothetical protein
MTSAGQRLADKCITSETGSRDEVVTGEPNLVEDQHRAHRRQ